MACKCKVGKCHICSSDCKRCGCGCDGNPPSRVQDSKPGGPKRQDASFSTPALRERSAAKKAKTLITKVVNVLNKPEIVDDQDSLFSSTRSLFSHFGWDHKHLNNFPSAKDRQLNKDLKETNKQGWSTMKQTLLQAIAQVAEFLYPADPSTLVEEYCSQAINMDTYEKKTERVEQSLLQAYKHSKIASIERRCFRAVLIKSLGKNRVIELRNSNKITIGNDQIAEGYVDFRTIVENSRLIKIKKHMQRFSSEALEDAVKFILHSSNILTLSWGTTIVKLGNEHVELPRLVRRRTCKDIYSEYVNRFSENLVPFNLKLGRTAIYKMLGAITCSGERFVTAVDYCVGVLIHDPVEMLQNIIDLSKKASIP